MSNAFAHDELGGHVRVIQALHEPRRLQNRYGFVLVGMNLDCWRISSSDMSHREYSRGDRATWRPAESAPDSLKPRVR